MAIRGPNDNLTILAEKAITGVFKSALKRTGGKQTISEIEQAVDTILSELENCSMVEVSDVENKCILITMRCNNYQGLLELLEYLESSLFRRRLQELSTALEVTYKEHFNISSQISRDDLAKIFYNLSKYIYQYTFFIKISSTYIFIICD